MKKPNLFIIGAPKCGTTSVYNWLKEHPEIFMPSIKEPHHFYQPYGKRMRRDEYEKLFLDASGNEKVLGEASVWYMFSGAAIDRILEYNPEAKFIVLLRNPIEMSVSLHNQHRINGHELVVDFEKAWKLNNKRASGNDVKLFGFKNYENVDLEIFDYKKACNIGTQLEYVLSKVNRQNILCIFLDDIKENAESIYKEILKFLDVGYYSRNKFSPKNQSITRRSFAVNRVIILLGRFKKYLGLENSFGILTKLRNLNSKSYNYSDISLSFKRKMLKEFEDEINLLESLLSRNLSEWKKIDS